MKNESEIKDKHYNFCKKYLLPNIHKTILQIEDYEMKQKITDVFSEENFKDLICSCPVDIKLADEINSLIENVKGSYTFLTPKGYIRKKNRENETGQFKDVISALFLNTYLLFSDKDDSSEYVSEKFGKYKWNSYEYVQKCGLHVCPYCNSEFIYTQLESKNADTKKIGNLSLPRITIRPQLDHFIAKEKKPLLAISLFNLVPSCKTCNVSIKHSIELNNEQFMNPLYENIYSYITFSNIYSPQNDHYSNITGRSKNFELSVLKRKDYFEEKTFIKAKNTIDVFRIIERYEPYFDYIQFIIARELLYTKLYSKSLENDYPNLFSKGEVEKLKRAEQIKYNDFIFSKIVQDLLWN
ncbi:hypothetical protein [Enterococcus sp. C57]|uniref:hypothetical protein n=1 Tax=Enterococcus sp. C57 TaxID=3231318 RepID=UPI0034A09CAB